MSTKVVSAPAKVAKPLVHKEKTAKPAEHAQPVQDDDAKIVGKEARATEETAKVILAQAEDGKEHHDARSETSMTSLAGDFSFAGALADAAATSGSLITQGNGVDSFGFAQSDDDGGPSGTILLVGAVALVGLGVAVLAGGGNGKDEVLNTAPVFGTAPTVTVAEDAAATPFTVTATDADGNALTYTATAGHGTIAGGTGGAFTYKPNANYNGAETITVTVNDGAGGTATQTINFTVSAVNDAPVAATESIAVTGNEDAAITVTPTITDVDDTTLTFTHTEALNGTVVVNANGTLTYTPDANYSGTDSFVVTGTDAAGAHVSQTVNVTVVELNDDAPVKGPDTTTAITVEQGDSAPFVIDFSDPDTPDNQLTATVSTQPAHGTIVDGAYVANDDYVGTDSFVITVTDGTHPVTYTVNVTVTEPTGPTELTIDVPPSGNPVTIDVGDDAYALTDDVDARTDVILTDFSDDDHIVVTGATADDYSFGTSPSDSHDLRITFNDGTNFTQIVIDDVLTNSGFVFDYDSAAAAVGFDFMTFA
ncbi:tandem-95 repeat protein [Novosphingobium album (ex Liu et al. 2023)]|uniref:Tandem-95 repeat protein n=1 Tax=Novosphingobium album (ex Liu et al. 2023) TaxID=3031130 RepID=A0ABT5WP84_9SPHN|nr:tandem-95 repeat protein [Novosphingobium album (ex Liu et al. 2023)]MDE8651826.1 tandem-95 repeat protein [Novosphingobium album (ex Liu et al. 2023)]